MIMLFLLCFLRDARLKLCEAVADCIKSGLDMLGIGVVEKM